MRGFLIRRPPVEDEAPEPATMLLAASALIGFGILRRRANLVGRPERAVRLSFGHTVRPSSHTF